MKVRWQQAASVIWITAIAMIAGKAAEFHPLDISAHTLRPWGSFQPFADWTFPAGGLQTFNGVPFNIAGCVQLTGLEHARKGSFRPTIVRFAVDRSFTQVHLLHYTEFSSTFGQPVARVLLHYDQGEPYGFPLLFGVHCMDWYHNSGQAPASGETTTCVWMAAPADGRSRQVTGIWHTAVPNPYPAKKVKSVEIQSMFAKSTYTLLGLTLEQGDPRPALDERPPPRRRFPPVVLPGSKAVRFVDATTGRPVAFAKAAVALKEGDRRMRWGDYVADAEGRLTVLLPPWSFYDLEVTAASAEHQPTFFALDESAQLLAATNQISVLNLARGNRIGGLVHDRAGRAVAEATVSISTVEGEPGRFALFQWPLARTDASGRWSSIAAPSMFRGLEIRVTHPKFLPGEYEQGDGNEPFHVTAGQLVKGEAIMRLESGATISGRVMDQTGHAITNARIACFLADDPNVHRRATTDATGHYAIDAVEPGDAAIMVLAAGHAPALERRKVDAGEARVDMKLSAAAPLRLKVQSADGRPLGGAYLVLLEWQGFRPLDLMRQSDAAGMLTCETAPTSDANYLITAMGGSSEIRDLRPGANLPVVVLRSGPRR